LSIAVNAINVIADVIFICSASTER